MNVLDEDGEGMYNFKTLIIMRGIPGSGKSSIAASLTGGDCRHVTSNSGARYLYGREGVVCSTDSYFYDEWSPDGNYVFDPSKLGKNHAANQQAVADAMNMGVPCIVVDNTHVQKWETDAYTGMAEANGYKIVVVEVPHVSVDLCDERNSHGVPREALERMDNKWEMFRVAGTDGEEIA